MPTGVHILGLKETYVPTCCRAVVFQLADTTSGQSLEILVPDSARMTDTLFDEDALGTAKIADDPYPGYCAFTNTDPAEGTCKIRVDSMVVVATVTAQAPKKPSTRLRCLRDLGCFRSSSRRTGRRVI